MLTLIPASRATMPFRQMLMSDPETMAYNAPWFPPDGTIAFPESEWDTYLAVWTNAEPERFLGYLQNEAGELVGEVCWHGFGTGMGIVIHAACRGRGYGARGLSLLMERAFSHPEILWLENTFESDRDPAMGLHLRAGFFPVREENGYIVLRKNRPSPP